MEEEEHSEKLPLSQLLLAIYQPSGAVTELPRLPYLGVSNTREKIPVRDTLDACPQAQRDVGAPRTLKTVWEAGGICVLCTRSVSSLGVTGYQHPCKRSQGQPLDSMGRDKRKWPRVAPGGSLD